MKAEKFQHGSSLPARKELSVRVLLEKSGSPISSIPLDPIYHLILTPLGSRVTFLEAFFRLIYMC